MLFWPMVVCGSSTYRSDHLVHVFPSHLGMVTGDLAALLVSPFNVKWRFSAPAEGVEGFKVLPLLGDFAFKVCLQCLSLWIFLNYSFDATASKKPHFFLLCIL
jgi:hypothetical protein